MSLGVGDEGFTGFRGAPESEQSKIRVLLEVARSGIGADSWKVVAAYSIFSYCSSYFSIITVSYYVSCYVSY